MERTQGGSCEGENGFERAAHVSLEKSLGSRAVSLPASEERARFCGSGRFANKMISIKTVDMSLYFLQSYNKTPNT